MSNAMNPAAPHFLPSFITAPGETDYLLTGVAVFLVVLVLFLGSMYFWLHSIPERLAHGSSKVQFQLVAVMSLLALFTHNNAFWVAALLLALVPVPDFWTPLATMADSLVKMAGRRLGSAPAVEATVTTRADGAAGPSASHVATISLKAQNEAGIIAPQAEDGVVASAGTAEAAASGPVLPGSDRPPVAATSGAGQRRALSTEGA